MSANGTYLLRLPRSIKMAAEKAAKEEGVSLNQFLSIAVAEKLTAMNTAAFFFRAQGARGSAGLSPVASARQGSDATNGRRAATQAEPRLK